MSCYFPNVRLVNYLEFKKKKDFAEINLKYVTNLPYTVKSTVFLNKTYEYLNQTFDPF